MFIISISAKKGVSLHYQISTKTKTNIFELFSFSQFIQAFPSVKERVRERERHLLYRWKKNQVYVFDINLGWIKNTRNEERDTYKGEK